MTRKQAANVVRRRIKAVANENRWWQDPPVFRVHAHRAGGRCVIDVHQIAPRSQRRARVVRVASAPSWLHAVRQAGGLP